MYIHVYKFIYTHMYIFIYDIFMYMGYYIYVYMHLPINMLVSISVLTSFYKARILKNSSLGTTIT
jgi:hypothetical protein